MFKPTKCTAYTHLAEGGPVGAVHILQIKTVADAPLLEGKLRVNSRPLRP